ncbi:helix-turn-helix domain-containing protein [Tsukamurella sp. 8F]|uniref:PucR family transcriptional regulator n=1 Tax=unclassified Tsukamurella TaxID=2633480 RepID=UPI0023B9B96D|nr:MULTISPECIES: helix-turn-helix domain-containing protein [unclassified Tsukamurella]MDF0532605.1 helix-turn-helix domain-containing protein [Tsukamurella sp. 8J]MDF0589138.1 helix-turn-helix domain-containing protein [Tsukamurella sp. 8F]
MDPDEVESETARVAAELARRIPAVARVATAAIRREIPFYATSDVVPEAMTQRSVEQNLRFVADALSSAAAFDVSPAVDTGSSRAELGVPLPAVMHAYRITMSIAWHEISSITEGDPPVGRATLLAVTRRLWDAHDVFTDAMAGAHREHTTQRALDHEAERAALTEHLLQGRVGSDQSLWEIAELLRIPRRGPYLAIAAEAPTVGRQALPGIDARLRALDAHCAWRLLPDQQIGIAYAPTEEIRAAVLDLLRRVATTRVGVSAPFADLAYTPQALRFARVALTGPGGLVTVFDGSALGITVASSPEASADVARGLLGGLLALPEDDAGPLFETFRAWEANGGNAAAAAGELFCHPNTVRHRLRRIEQLTGRSTTAPRDVAELCLAFEAAARFGIGPGGS